MGETNLRSGGFHGAREDTKYYLVKVIFEYIQSSES